MAERDRTTAGIEPCGIGAEFAPPGKRHGSERLIDFEMVNVFQLHSAFPQNAAGGGNGSGQHHQGIVADDASSRARGVRALQPQVATVAELGYPGYELPIWIGLSVPAGTPTDRIDALNRAMREALNDEEVKKRMLALGVTAVGSTPSEFAAFLEKERVRWVTMVKETGVLDR
jgi:tripartite-type tricarboxylate transporter receptor subunit TctC